MSAVFFFLVKKVTKVFLHKKAYPIHLYQADPCEQTFQNALDQIGKDDTFFQDLDTSYNSV